MSADAHALDRPGFIEQRFGGGESREHVDTKLLRLCAENGISCPRETMKLPWFAICGGVIGSLYRLRRVRNTNSSRVAGTQIAGHARASWEQFVERTRLENRTGERMSAEACSLFQHAHREFGLQLFQADGAGEAAGPPPTMATSYSMTSR